MIATLKKTDQPEDVKIDLAQATISLCSLQRPPGACLEPGACFACARRWLELRPDDIPSTREIAGFSCSTTFRLAGWRHEEPAEKINAHGVGVSFDLREGVRDSSVQLVWTCRVGQDEDQAIG